jgi:hypothetical protein
MGATQKVSLTMGRHALRLAKTAADRTGMSLSSLVNTALELHLASLVEELERRRAAEEVIATFPPEHLPTAQVQRELLALWSNAKPGPTEAEIEALSRRSRPRTARQARPSLRSKARRRK